MHNYLKDILKHKEIEIAKLQQQIKNNPDSLLAQIYANPKKQTPKKSFQKALIHGNAIIAEIKRKSPSKSDLAEITNPVELAKKYVQGGASAISILTDQYGFNGNPTDLTQVSQELYNHSVPLLRKDFTLDSMQIAEAITIGADAILLIVSILKEKTQELLRAAHAYGIDALVEVHDRSELDYALSIDAKIIGVNNRNLTTFAVDTNNAKNLIKYIPDSVISIAESGMQDAQTAKEFLKLGFKAVLIGEALVTSSSPEKFINDIKY